MSAEPPVTIPKGPRALAFGVSWMSYATYYFGRKGVGVVKTSITAELGERALYGVETALLVAYALGQYVNGFLGDRLGARTLIAVGLCLSAVSCFAFGLSSLGIAFIVAYFVNGIAQSTGWPGNAKAMSEWTTSRDRGRVMGLWSTCYQAGGIIAAAACTRLAQAFGWRWAFFGPAIALPVVAVLVYLLLRPGPNRAGASATPGEEPSAAERERLSRERALEQKRLVRSPLLYSYGASYFCIKLVRYSLLFWLPLYLERQLGYSKTQAGYLSTSFEVGGLAGTILLGYLSDRMRDLPRAGIALVSLVGLAGALALYGQVGGTSMVVNFTVMALVGLLLFGPDSLLSGAAAQDAGGKHGAALAAGMINGLGSLGAILQEAVTRGVSSRWGWGALFHVFVGLALAAALCLVPAIRSRSKGLAVEG